MYCCTSCLIAITFLIANIYIIISSINDNKKQNLYNVLDDKQKKIYNNIVNERKNIYFTGYLVGIILSIIFVYSLKYILRPKKLQKISIICLVTSITFITNYLYYILYPKTDYMVLHLTDKRQVEEWLNIYKYMQFKYHLAFVIGIISVVIFTYGYCDN